MNIHSQPLNYTVNLCYKLAGGAYRARVTARVQLEWQPESSSFLSSGRRLGVCLAKYRMKKAGKKSDLKAVHKVIFFTKMADIHHRRLLVRIDSEFSENQERM